LTHLKRNNGDIPMRSLLSLLVLLAVLFGSTAAMARGSGADDCPPGSTDPDCVAKPNGK
jgi:hypothetical protein